MKTFTFFLLVILIACKKSDVTPSSVTTSPIFGQWKWYKTWERMGNVVSTPQSTGETWSLQVNTDFTCSSSGNYFPAQNGTFTLTTKPSPYGPPSVIADYINISFTSGIFSNYVQEWDYWFYGSRDSVQMDAYVETDGPSYYFVRTQ